MPLSSNLSLLVSSTLLALALGLAPSSVRAQDGNGNAAASLLLRAPSAALELDIALGTELDLTLEERAELSSIDAESTAATIVYIASLVLHVGGWALIAIPSGTSYASYTSHPTPSGSGDNHAATFSGMTIGALGVVGVIVAGALDTDSGLRRRGWRERRQARSIDVAIAPSAEGASLVLTGSF